MELLLTGSTGFVGRNLLLHLAADPRWSRILLPVRDREKLLTQMKAEGIAGDDRFVPIPVSGDLWQLPPDTRPDLAIHAAGLLFGRRKEDYFRVNVEGSLRLAAQLPKTCRLVLISSLAAGGPAPRGASFQSTEHEDHPVSWYGVSKLTLERELRNRWGRRLLILRPPMVLGPRDTATVPLFRMARGVVRIKPGFADKHYSWIEVGALCSAILAAAARPEEGERHAILYPGADEIITDRELIGTAAAVLGSRGITLPIPQAAIRLASLALDVVPAWRSAMPSLGIDRVREILPRRWICNPEPFRQAFGWKQEMTLGRTLEATSAWLSAQGIL